LRFPRFPVSRFQRPQLNTV